MKTPSAAVKAIYILIVAFVCLAVLNTASSVILKNKSELARYTLNTRLRDGRGFLDFCYRGGSNRNFDFSLARLDARRAFAEIFTVGREKVDPKQEIFCAQYPGETLDLFSRAENLPPKRQGERRIVFIGDSFTFGSGVPVGAAFPDRIQQLLDFSGNPGGFRTLNLGLFGKDFPELYSVNFKAALAAQPDVIVYVWMMNDAPARGPAAQGFKEINDFVNLKPQAGGSGPALLQLVQTAATDKRIAAKTAKWYRDLYGPVNRRGTAEMRGMLRRMKHESARAGADFKVALFPIIAGSRGNYPFADVHARFADMLRHDGIAHFDLTGTVLDRPAQDLWVHPLDHHPNASAHLNAAREIIRALELLPETNLKEIAPESPGVTPLAGWRSGHVEAFAEAAAENLPRDAVYYTDSPGLAQTLEKAAAHPVHVVKSPKTFSWKCAAGNKCIFAFIAKNKMEAFIYNSHMQCPDHYLAGNEMLFFCPFSEMRK